MHSWNLDFSIPKYIQICDTSLSAEDLFSVATNCVYQYLCGKTANNRFDPPFYKRFLKQFKIIMQFGKGIIWGHTNINVFTYRYHDVWSSHRLARFSTHGIIHYGVFKLASIWSQLENETKNSQCQYLYTYAIPL